MQDSEKRNPRRKARYDTNVDEPDTRYNRARTGEKVVPATGGPAKALVLSAVTGIVGAVVNIGITLLSSPVYHQAAQEGAKTVSSVDYIITALGCLSIFVNLLACYIAGAVVGRATRKQLGFYAGAAAGVVMFLCSFLTNWIPNYPGSTISSHGPTTVTAFSGGIITSLIFLIVWLFVGGLIGLMAAGRSLRKYAPYALEDE